MSSPRISGKRNLPRLANVSFRFCSDDGRVFDVVSVDASIRAARFSHSDRARIAEAVSGHAAFGRIRLDLKRIEIEPSFDRADSFVVTYRTAQLSRGARLRGHHATYETLDFLSAGQSAETYKARVTSLEPDTVGMRIDEEVVIKIPLFIPNLADAQLEDFISNLARLFTREETSLRRLADLDCVASFLDIGTHEFPLQKLPATKFMVQRFIRGHSLGEYLESNYADQESGAFTGLSGEEFYRHARALADAVRKVHSKLVIHGDIWPENIIVRQNGELVLIDFGQAVFREAMGDVVQIPGRNSRYIAAEKSRSVGGDVYSLGGVLHYLATGEDPPEKPAETIDDLKSAIADKIRTKNHRLYRENRGAVDVIARCLRQSERRTAHAHGVIEELDTFFDKPTETQLPQAVESIAFESQQLSSHELFRWMASLRVNALRADLSDMASGVYDLVGDHELIVAGLTQYIGLLREGDEYLTVSVPGIWHPENLGVNGRFLAMNTIAAQRGAVVKRLFVITPTDRDDPNFDHIMKSQRDMIRELSEEDLSGHYEVRVLEVTQVEGENILKRGHHFGLLAKQGDEIAVFAEYRSDGSLAAVRFRAGLNLVGGLREVFQEYWEQATPMDISSL